MGKNNEKLNKYAGAYIIKVLDTNYDLYIDNENYELDSQNYGGLTDCILKTIHIENVFLTYDDEKTAELEFKRLLRHELIHAFIYECGLTENSSESVPWTVSESLVDWLATQFYKLDNLFKDAYQIIKDIKKTVKK